MNYQVEVLRKFIRESLLENVTSLGAKAIADPEGARDELLGAIKFYGDVKDIADDKGVSPRTAYSLIDDLGLEGELEKAQNDQGEKQQKEKK